MIPTHWTPVHRPDDGQHVGYVGADGEARLLTGALLAPDDGEARDLLASRGLPALDRRWWCRLPPSLARGLVDAGAPERDWEWRPVVIVEASPQSCTVRPEWPAPAELAARAVLPVPVGDLLLEVPPGGSG